MSTKKVIEVGKRKKNIVFYSKLILSIFLKRLIFWQHQFWAVVAAVNLISELQFLFKDLQHLWQGVFNTFTMLNYTHLTSFKQTGSFI